MSLYNFDIDVDIDLRKEFNDWIEGTDKSKRIGSYCVLQSIVLDENGVQKRSPYANKYTGEVKLTQRFPNTTVTGYLCNERIIKAYITSFQPRLYATLETAEPGLDNESKYLVFIEADKDIDIKSGDVIVTIKLDENGNIINPVEPVTDYVVLEVPDARGDYGRTEFKMAIVKIIK